MKTLNFPTSACRLCRHYQPQGRRGGTCEQLGVPVRANWQACSLAIPPFTTSWEKMAVIWQDDTQLIEETFSVSCSLDSSQPEVAQEALSSISSEEKLTADIILA